MPSRLEMPRPEASNSAALVAIDETLRLSRSNSVLLAVIDEKPEVSNSAVPVAIDETLRLSRSNSVLLVVIDEKPEVSNSAALEAIDETLSRSSSVPPVAIDATSKRRSHFISE